MMGWVFKMLAHPKASQELQYGLQAIQPTMTDPNVPREEKRRTLSAMVEELSEDTFKLEPVADQIMIIINMEEEVCREYDDTDSQVEGILSWLPRMAKHRERLTKEVQKHRKKCGLKL